MYGFAKTEPVSFPEEVMNSATVHMQVWKNFSVAADNGHFKSATIPEGD